MSQGISSAIFSPQISQTDVKIPIFPIVNLWGVWNNVVLYTSFDEAIYVGNLFTNHTKIFYLYDLNWHKTSLSYQFTLESILAADILVCRSSYHADKIEEYSGRRPILINELNLKEIINDRNNYSASKN